MDTRFYGERQRDYKRECINGEFEDNFGGWECSSSEKAKIKFSIDTMQVISGKKAAKIEILKSGDMPRMGFLKWEFNANKSEKVSIRFKAKSLQKTDMIVRLETMRNLSVKYIDKVVPLTEDVQTFEFESEELPSKGSYQLVFYVGKSKEGTIWLDDIEMTFGRD